MDFFFVLLTQLMNKTTFTLSFQVDNGRRLLPELPPGKTRFAKTSRVLRRLRELHDDDRYPGWKIRVLLDGEFTGIELDPKRILKYVRVVFCVEGAEPDLVLCVDGVRENRNTDFLLRQRYFGCMRNYFWDARTAVSIDRSDTKLATKSRNVVGHCQELAPWVDTHLPLPDDKRYATPHNKSPRSKIPPPNPSPEETLRRERSRNDIPRPLNPSNEQFLFEKIEKSHNSLPMNYVMEVVQQERLRDNPPPRPPPHPTGGLVDGEDSADGVGDSFVHVFLFVLAMIFCTWFKFRQYCN